MKRLQVKLNEVWEYVFCRNALKHDPIITKDARKALRGDALEYFSRNFPNHEFRIA